MKLKLDENLGRTGAQLLRDAGHDVATVAEQGLCAAADHRLISVCRAEDRCLITLDTEFANPLLFKPSRFSGICLLRLPGKPDGDALLAALRTLAGALAREDMRGKLWVVQRGRVRVYQEDNQAEG